MSRLFKVLLKAVGLKTLLRWGWRYAIYPRLKYWTESNKYPDWDERLLKFVNDNINKAIDLL